MEEHQISWPVMKLDVYLLKLSIFLRIINFWLHLEILPDNSISKRFPNASNQLDNIAKSSSMSTITELIKQYANDLQKFRATCVNNHITEDVQIIIYRFCQA